MQRGLGNKGQVLNMSDYVRKQEKIDRPATISVKNIVDRVQDAEKKINLAIELLVSVRSLGERRPPPP